MPDDGNPPDAAALKRRPETRIPRVASGQADPGRVDEEWLRQLTRVSGARVRRSLEKVLLAPNVQPALERLQEAGVLAVVLPELDATLGLATEGGHRHKDVWAHTVQVVAQSPARPVVRWAALLHDIGKVHTRAFEADGTVTFRHHAEVGAAIFQDPLSGRLEFSPAQSREVHQLIVHHQRPAQYSPAWQDSAVRRFYREMGASLPDLLDLSRADVTSRIPGRREAVLLRIDELAQRIAVVAALDARKPPLPPGVGNAIMERFGMAPGPRVGRLRQGLLGAIEAGELEPHQPTEYYLDYLEQSALLV